MSLAAAGTITDSFHQTQTGCGYNFGPTFSNCDVIGDPSKFDIEKADVQVNAASINVTLYFNYGGGPSLSGFQNMQVGDLFFYDPADPLTHGYDPNNAYPEYRYGVPLTNHNGLTAGNLYLIPDFNSLQTADALIHDTGYYYRRTQPVWMPGGVTLASMGSGVNVVANGDGVTHALYAATIQMSTPPGFLDMISGGQLSIGFSSAICGNDVMLGPVKVDGGGSVPEPRTFAMFGIGLALIGAGTVRRKRSGA